MVKYFDSISDDLKEWAMNQAIFFTASAPTYGKHVNLSPKGLPSTSFSVLSPNQCAYIDATGSGNETISHIRENGRCTIMFCSFAASPRILRFFARGTVIEWDSPLRAPLVSRMSVGSITGARAVILLDVFKVQTSCGFGVPCLALEEHPEKPGEKRPVLADRDTIGHWAKNKVEKGELEKYQADNNVESLDGLPGLRIARRRAGERVLAWGDLKAGVRGKARGLWHVAGAAMLVAVVSCVWTVMVLLYSGLLDVEVARERWRSAGALRLEEVRARVKH